MTLKPSHRLLALLALGAACALPATADGNRGAAGAAAADGVPGAAAGVPATGSGATETGAEAPRHAAWSALLDAYVRPGSDGLNRFDYGALKANPADRAALTGYIESFAAFDFDALPRDDAFAAWANLYNALTVEHILSRYPVDSIRDGYFIGPWKEVTTLAGGQEVSLDAIEHDILRVQWDDPRVHYAVNCASVGCPNLRTEAWNGDTLDADLDAAARAYVNDPRGVTVRDDGQLRVSRIYKWFREDFGGSDAGVIAHLSRHADDELRAVIEAGARIRGHQYDWSLNDVEN